MKELGAALEKAQDGELGDEDLENVAGGGVIKEGFEDIIYIADKLVQRETWDRVGRWFRRW